MTYAVHVAARAADDLRDLFAYIAFALQSPENAAGQLDRLERGIASLDQMPERFPLYDRGPWPSRGLRVMPVDNYLVFYVVDQKERLVTVVRVLYGRRDIGRQLEEYAW